MSEHPNSVQGLTAEDLASQFAKTAYGYQAEFFKKLESLYDEEAQLEYGLNHPVLEVLLWEARRRVDALYSLMRDVWDICEDKTTIKEGGLV
jgi:hypothetical protein